MSQFTGLEHTAIASPDPEKLAQWYASKLDFVINYRYGGNVFVRAPNGAMLEIIPSEGERAPQKMKDPGIRHLAISVTDFEAGRQDLQARGVKLLGDPLNLNGNLLQFFEDGDGNYVHLIRRPQPLP